MRERTIRQNRLLVLVQDLAEEGTPSLKPFGLIRPSPQEITLTAVERVPACVFTHGQDRLALVDWPQQGRLVELVDNRDGTGEFWLTMFDYDTEHTPLGALADGARPRRRSSCESAPPPAAPCCSRP